MNEDEAFIRVVVDSPGDDTPRLVYADWLDDQSDPRGPYLRAETEWAKARRRTAERRLRPLARKLDLVWVARVSRPPLGVCCDHLLLSSTGGGVRPAELDAAADELGVTLPAHLRALLLNYNLGHLRGGPFVLPGEGGRRGTPVDGFVCVNDPDLIEGAVSCELVGRTVWEREEYGLSEEFVFLAATLDDTDLVVSCRPSERGAVFERDGYEMYDDPDAVNIRVASSVGELLAILEPRPWPLTDV